MRLLLIAIVALGMGQAEAAPLCATPAELRLLKAAMLEQVLTSAALSCHQSAQFARFVAAYHSGMVANDRTLKSFFARRKTGESYEAFKARIAGEVAVRSLHDGKFCAEAGRIFAIALKHEKAAAPKLIATGYEHCGAPQMPKPILAELALRPVKPAPKAAPVPVLSPIARNALALASRKENPPQSVVTQAVPVKAAKATPVARAPLHADVARAEPVLQSADEDKAPHDRLPNAYKPGAYWVDDEAETNRPPRQRPPLEQGPDGRLYVVVGHHDHWTND